MGVPRNLRGEATVQGILVLKGVVSGLAQPTFQGNEIQLTNPGYAINQNYTNFGALYLEVFFVEFPSVHEHGNAVS